MKTLILVVAALTVSMVGMSNSAHAAAPRGETTKKVERIVAPATEGCTIETVSVVNTETGEIETVSIVVCDQSI